MIELTSEQWQVLAQEETPTMIDPRSQMAYVVVPKTEYDNLKAAVRGEADAASVLRIAWMRHMGLDEDEIAESLRDNPPHCLQDEMKQVKALDNLDKITPPGEVLRKLAITY